MAISTIGQNGLNAPLSLTSPNLGTPSALVLTNATALPKAALPTGSVLQVVNATSATIVTSTNATLLTISVTPLSASNKILLIGNATLSCNPGSNAYAVMQIKKNGSVIAQTYSGFNSAIFTAIPFATLVLDAPATTSAISYTLNMSTGSGGTSSVTTSEERYVITAMEIAG